MGVDYIKERATKRLVNLKLFIKHICAFVFINSVLAVFIYFNQEISLDFRWYAFFNAGVFWGMVLLFHALWVYVPFSKRFRTWESKKMNNLLNE